MKKLFTSLTALALVSAMVVPFAVSANEPGQGTEFTKTIPEGSYTVIVPATFNLDESSSPFTIQAYGTGRFAGITVTADYNARSPIANDANDIYGLFLGGDTSKTPLRFEIPNRSVTFSAETLNAADSQNPAPQSMGMVVITGIPTQAGDYRGQVTFTVANATTD